MESDDEAARPIVEQRARALERLAATLVDLSVSTETLQRVTAWLRAYSGSPVSDDLPEVVRGPVMLDSHNELVQVKDIQFTALCEHHLLPFVGRAAVGYVPQGQIIGLSKLARIVHYYTQRPTLQEHITTNVAEALQRAIHPEGIMVVLYDVMHSCMSMRGVKEREATTTTSAVRGVFKHSEAARTEFLAFMRSS